MKALTHVVDDDESIKLQRKEDAATPKNRSD